MLKKQYKRKNMQWHDFVFSNQPRQRFLRHAIFWLTWWVYFSAIYYLYQQTQPGTGIGTYVNLGSDIFLKTFLLLLIQGIACYTFIYFLLPRYIVKAKWLKLITGILLICIVIVIAGYFVHGQLFPFVDVIFNNPPPKTNLPVLWSSISAGLLNAPKVVGAAVAIKLMKRWWLNQKEKEKLEREKINTELQLLKAQIRPGFLFNTLNNIYAYSLAGSPRASEMLLRLSDLVSYMLYECDKPLVPLEKEIEMMKEYIMLEKIKHHDNLEMEVSVKGELAGKKIVPFLLLPFIENSFKQCRNMTEQSWMNMEIRMEGDYFSMKLINGMAPEISGQPEMHSNRLANVQKRLTLLYPEKHELRIGTEQEMHIIFLRIQLEEKEERITDIADSTHHAEFFLTHANL
jgi:Putative regulator of cell autolysis